MEALVYLILEWVGDAWMEIAIVDDKGILTIEKDLQRFLEEDLDTIIESTKTIEREGGCKEIKFYGLTYGEHRFYVRPFTMNKLGK